MVTLIEYSRKASESIFELKSEDEPVLGRCGSGDNLCKKEERISMKDLEAGIRIRKKTEWLVQSQWEG